VNAKAQEVFMLLGLGYRFQVEVSLLQKICWTKVKI
jgi:hypothetical protein